MTRARSPQYPSLSLPQAVDMVAKLHKANRTSVITRETAAKDMGYAGLTGRSLTVIAALAQFGLIEKAGKGDIKVTRRAVDILHSVDEADQAEAVQEAAFAPNLFQQLQERFPEGVPSQNALRSYLIQQEFGDVAIGPAISAYLETIAFAEKAKESGRTGDGASNESESPTTITKPDVNVMQQLARLAAPVHAAPPVVLEVVGRASSRRDIVPNEVYLDIRGSREVYVEGILDYNGILDLEEKLNALKMILKKPNDCAASLQPIEPESDQ
jgi:hypothetical protein